MRPQCRSLLLLAIAALALATVFGCGLEPREQHDVRLAAERYLSALAGKDLELLRQRATCVVAVQAVLGGNVLQIGSTRRLLLSRLDSLSEAAGQAHRTADSVWVHAKDGERDLLFRESRRTGRLEVIYRNAIRAMALSNPDSLHGSATLLETRTVRTRVRYGGAFVGPRPVDREMILRLVRAPAGRWIAFSFYAAEDDPRPDGV
jgi:hypothetical protein